MISRDEDHGVSSQKTIVVARLQLQQGTCLHTNTIREISLEDQLDFGEPEVVSSHTEHTQNAITRRTVVKYLKKKYIIQDVYQFDYSPGLQTPPQAISPSIQSSSDKQRPDELSPIKDNQRLPNKDKKLCIFHKQLDNGKRNTKNLPKNFFKGFLALVQDKAQNQNLEQLLRLLHDLRKGAKYNNILIQKLLSNSRIAPYFREFLESHAEKWIKHSKITDKGIHLKAIPIYLSLFDKYHYAEGDENSSDM